MAHLVEDVDEEVPLVVQQVYPVAYVLDFLQQVPGIGFLEIDDVAGEVDVEEIVQDEDEEIHGNVAAEAFEFFRVIGESTMLGKMGHYL